MKFKQERLICPLCLKEFKTTGWYKRHCLTVHNALVPYIPKKLIDGRDIEAIFHKIEQIEQRLINMSQGVISKHDIDIKPLRPEIKKSMSIQQLSFKECMNELKQVFNKGLTLLSKMDDIDIGIKTEQELEQLQLQAIQRSKSTNI